MGSNEATHFCAELAIGTECAVINPPQIQTVLKHIAFVSSYRGQDLLHFHTPQSHISHSSLLKLSSRLYFCIHLHIECLK